MTILTSDGDNTDFTPLANKNLQSELIKAVASLNGLNVQRSNAIKNYKKDRAIWVKHLLELTKPLFHMSKLDFNSFKI